MREQAARAGTEPSEVVVRGSGEGFAQEITAAGHRLVVGEPLAAGGTDEGPNPYDLLLAALGACTKVAVQVQMSPGCGHGQRTVALVREVLAELAPDARLETVTVATLDDAERLGFRGSPTVLVGGVDIEPGPPGGVGMG